MSNAIHHASGYVERPNGRQGYRRKMDRPPDEVIRVQVLDGIVREEDFARVQHLIELKSQKHWRGRTGMPERYTYNGFLTCGECGERLYTHTAKSEFYICKTRHTRERRKRALLNLEPCGNKYMLRHKLEPRIDSLIGERLQDSGFLAKVLRDYGERLASSSKRESPGVDQAAVVRKLDNLRAKKGRVLDAYFEGVIDRAQRDETLQDVDREIGSYNFLLGTSSVSLQPQSLPSLDAMMRVIEPLADWEFLSRDDRRTLLRQLCPNITVYQYTVKSLTLNLGAVTQPSSRYTGSHSRMAP